MKNLTEYINESMDYNPNPNNWPNISELGEGTFEGALWGHCFVYNEQKYFSNHCTLSIFPHYCRIIINEENIKMEPIDNCQRPELKALFI